MRSTPLLMFVEMPPTSTRSVAMADVIVPLPNVIETVGVFWVAIWNVEDLFVPRKHLSLFEQPE
jgi:hypothetical protein